MKQDYLLLPKTISSSRTRDLNTDFQVYYGLLYQHQAT